MPERLECEVLQKARYINTRTFTFYIYNVLRMSTASPDTRRETVTVTPLTDGCSNRIIHESHCFNSVSRHYQVSGKGITQASLEIQLQLCLE